MENGDGGSVIIMCEGKIREYFQRVFIFFNGNYGITLIGYLFFVIVAQAFLKGKEGISFLTVFIPVLLMCICPVIFRKAKRLKIILREKNISRKEKILWVLFFFIIMFCGFDPMVFCIFSRCIYRRCGLSI